MWERGGQQMTVWRMRIVCWIPEVANTNPEYVILIALPQQQWLHEGTLMLRYTYIAYPVCLFLDLGRMHKVQMCFLNMKSRFS